MFLKPIYNFLVLLLILFSLNSCVSQKLVHGNLPDAQLVSILKVGIDSKKTTTQILGEPTFRGVLGDNSFYYVGSVSSKLAFLDPKLDNQFVLELNFDKNDKLKKLYLYDENESIEIGSYPFFNSDKDFGVNVVIRSLNKEFLTLTEEKFKKLHTSQPKRGRTARRWQKPLVFIVFLKKCFK